MKKTIRRCALSLGLALLFSALPGYAAESGAYVTGLDDVWYILTEELPPAHRLAQSLRQGGERRGASGGA